MLVWQKDDNSTLRRDPHFTYYNGYYYYCCADKGERALIAKVKNITDLPNAEFKVVFETPKTGKFSKQLWAPELHIIDGKCYIYTCLSDGQEVNHRSVVLENGSDNPLDPYKIHGNVVDESNKWSIDMSVFNYNGKLYAIWSDWDWDAEVQEQCIALAEMSDPFTISSKKVIISRPTEPWEKIGSEGTKEGRPFVNEGPYALISKDNNLFVTYSASGCWTNFYCVCYVQFMGGEILDANNWKKCSEPILTQSEVGTGTGHNCFIKIDGEDYIVYHCFHEDCSFGERSVDVRCQKVIWQNGLPFVGKAE